VDTCIVQTAAQWLSPFSFVRHAAGGAIQSLGMLLLAHHLLSVQLAAAALLRPTPEQLRYQDQELGAL